VLLLLALLVPLHARAWGRVRDDRADGRVRVRWGGGVVSFLAAPEGLELRILGLRVSRLRGARKERGEKKPEAKKRDRDGKQRGPGWAWRHRRTLLRAMGRLLAALHPRGRVAGTVGLGDPMDMAALFALLASADERLRRLELDVACDWTEEVLDLDGTVRVLVWPLELLIVLLVVRLGADVRRALRAPA
jgi:hypothetical protein